jgi:hypothetical protein
LGDGPSQNSANNKGTNSSLAQKEEQYQRARERIFGKRSEPEPPNGEEGEAEADAEIARWMQPNVAHYDSNYDPDFDRSVPLPGAFRVQAPSFGDWYRPPGEQGVWGSAVGLSPYAPLRAEYSGSVGGGTLSAEAVGYHDMSLFWAQVMVESELAAKVLLWLQQNGAIVGPQVSATMAAQSALSGKALVSALLQFRSLDHAQTLLSRALPQVWRGYVSWRPAQ